MVEDAQPGDELWSLYEKEFEDYLDIPFQVTIVIGRTSLTIGELLNLDFGSIVQLPKSAGESFDVLANGKRVAKGDVTIMEDRFGVRVTEFLSPREKRT
jgi:flagellar motor switch protein FliN/FliY